MTLAVVNITRRTTKGTLNVWKGHRSGKPMPMRNLNVNLAGRSVRRQIRRKVNKSLRYQMAFTTGCLRLCRQRHRRRPPQRSRVCLLFQVPTLLLAEAIHRLVPLLVARASWPAVARLPLTPLLWLTVQPRRSAEHRLLLTLFYRRRTQTDSGVGCRGTAGRTSIGIV